MGAWVVVLLATLLGGAPPPASGVFGKNPSQTVQNAIALIDRNYLRATSNPAWKRAKRQLLSARYPSAAAAYRALGAQLAGLRDPEFYLVTNTEFRAREDELDAKRVGTGLASFAIDRDPATGYARVVTALGDSPAAHAGIRPRDLVVSIDGESTRRMSHERILDAFGVGAAKVRLVIRDRGRTRRVTLKASLRPLDAVQFSLRKTHGRKIGYIRVLLFTPDAGEQVQRAVERLDRSGADGFVLDLRNNPGGSLASAEGAARAFTAGVLGSEVRDLGRREPLETRGAPLTGQPLVVLINGGTASAAELLAAALRDLHRAVLVGTASFGRGRTQTYIPLSDGYGVLVPTAKIVTADGRALKSAGVRPDLRVGGDFVPERRIATRHDPQFQRALAVLDHS